jgi:hypothetical protein
MTTSQPPSQRERFRTWNRRNAAAVATIRNWVFQAVFTGIALCAFILLMSIIYKSYFNAPPILVEQLDPKDLGVLCPGDSHPVSDRITIEHPIVLVLYTATLDAAGTQNVEGTQTVFPGRPNPSSSTTFIQHVPWKVPNIPPGQYTRVFAIRGTNGAEDPVFVESKYTIGSDCPPDTATGVTAP